MIEYESRKAETFAAVLEVDPGKFDASAAASHFIGRILQEADEAKRNGTDAPDVDLGFLDEALQVGRGRKPGAPAGITAETVANLMLLGPALVAAWERHWAGSPASCPEAGTRREAILTAAGEVCARYGCFVLDELIAQGGLPLSVH